MIRLSLFLILLGCLVTGLGFAQPSLPQQRLPQQHTYCNPMDIGYRYNFEQLNEGISYRSGADPVIINHKNEYYLFVTISGGWWHSKDLVNWEYIVPDKWPMEDMCAPAALSVRDTLYLFQSTFEQRPIFISTEPEKGKLKFYNRWLPRLPKDIGPWDPALFHDNDTDKWFMYWGSSNVYPIFGAELDKSRNLTYAGPEPAKAYQAMFWLDPYQHGWERFGPNHSDPIKPFMEGAWMTKYNGKYYLQYAGPGTEYNVYGNGTYVGKSPLGPWEYAPYNPIAYKPGGFATGTGHGNTFQDNFGNYWNTGTTWIGVNWGMERRIVMHPAGFDQDDQMNVNTRFGDFPHYLPTRKSQTRDELFTGWMLLNYRKTVVASSTLTASGAVAARASFTSSQAVIDTVTADRVADENPRTFWVAGKNTRGDGPSGESTPGATLTSDLGSACDVRAVQVDYFDYKNNVFASDSTVYTTFKLLTSLDNNRWETVYDASREPRRDRACAYVELAKPVRARYVRYEHGYTAGPYLSINAFRVFGNGLGKAPATPTGLVAKRQKDQRNADLSWTKSSGSVVGYNLRWGIAKDKLYQTYQIWHDAPNKLELRALNIGVPYFVAIEAFNESGISGLSEVVEMK